MVIIFLDRKVSSWSICFVFFFFVSSDVKRRHFWILVYTITVDFSSSADEKKSFRMKTTGKISCWQTVQTHTHTRKGCCFCSLRFPGKCYYWCSKRFSRYNTDALNETHRYLINTVYSIIFFIVQENWLFWFLNENAVDTSTETITRIIGIQPLAPILCAKTRNKMRKNEILSVSLRQICVCVQWLILFKKREKVSLVLGSS